MINIFFLIVIAFLLNVMFNKGEVEIDNRAVINESTNSIFMGVQWHAYIGKYFKDKENVEYFSCDRSVAEVTDNGKITGISIGRTNVIVKQIENGKEKILKNYVVIVNKIKNRRMSRNNFIYRKKYIDIQELEMVVYKPTDKKPFVNCCNLFKKK